MPENIIPGAVTVAVSSGKGGVGKSTTASSLAAALAARGIDVVVLDADIDGPNIHIIAAVAERALGVDQETLTLRLPTSPHGYRVVTPVSVLDADPDARVTVSDLIGIARFADPAQVVVVDLPPGWTDHHEAVCATLPDLVIAVVAPTRPALSDHERHERKWGTEWDRVLDKERNKDRRRKVTLPEAPTLVTVETMARFTGIPDNGTDPVTIRRLDAVAAAEVAELANPIASIPATATIEDAARTAEVGQLADHVVALVPALEAAGN